MSELLQSFIQEIVNSTKLKGRIEHELLRELTSHILEEEKELQLQGYSEEKITSIIIERFGDWQTIARELYMTHTSFTKKQLVGYGILIWFVISFILNVITTLPRCTDLKECGFMLVGFLPFISFSWIGLAISSLVLPFSLFFIGNTIGIFLLLWLIFSRLYFQRFFSSITAKGVAAWIIAQAVILQWLSLILSTRSVPYTGYGSEEISTIAGFPLKVFDFPINGGNEPPYSMWPKFYISYGIWFVVSIIIFLLLPKKIITHHRILTILITGAVMISLYGLGWIMFKFD